MGRSTEISNRDKVIDSRDVIKRIEELTEWKDAATELAAEHRARLKEIEESGQEDDAEEREGLESALWTATEAPAHGDPLGAGYTPALMIEYGETPDWTEAEHDELKALLSLQDDAEGSPDWMHGETLIADSYFEEYAQEIAEDCGMVKDTDKWPLTCINWEEAADELKQDYTQVDFDGETYWIRA